MTDFLALTRRRFAQWRAGGLWAWDLSLAAAITLPMFAIINGFRSEPGWLLPIAALVLGHRVLPEVSAVIVALLCVANLFDVTTYGHFPISPAPLLIPVVVHGAMAYGVNRQWGYWTFGATLIGIMTWFLIVYRRISDQATVSMGGIAISVAIASFLLGKQYRDRQDRMAERELAANERIRLLEAERDQRAEVGAAAERASIARELHDIVAHSLSVIIVQADGGRAAAEGKPAVALDVLETISQTGRAALAEMRRIVGVLRDPAAHTEFAPAPAATNIKELVESVTAAGLDVTLAMSGPLEDLPPPISLITYRVVQESLTNVIKHAGPSPRVEVTVSICPQEVALTVLDDGLGADAVGPAPGGGHGLRGMRERVMIHDGSVIAAPRAGGGFLVAVRIPLPPAQTEDEV